MEEYFSQLIHEFKLPLNNPVPIFFLILCVILISPVILNRLKIPGLIGLIISGIVIGPFGLNLLEKNIAIDLFSTIGLLYIMFMAGLDLDMNEFLENRKKSLFFGFLTFFVPLSMGFPVCYYLLEFNLDASLLTASLFSTHTLVAYPIVSKLGVSKNQAVAITVGGTIFTDTGVLLLLAVIMGNYHGGLNNEFWIFLAISLVIFSIIIFYLVPKIARWFFQKLEGEKHAHYIFVLSVVFLAAFLSELAGLEPIIGAFASGLALNRLIPQSSALMNRIEFIGNSLFIPFFLISVGMVIDLRVLLKGPMALFITGILLIVAFSSKWLAAFFTQIAFKYSKAQRNLIFGLSSSHAAAVLAVILVGFKAGIIDENVLNGTIILILISCIVASVVTEKAAKRIVIDSGGGFEKKIQLNRLSNEHILVPIANFQNINKLLEFALVIKDIKSANPVSILSIVPNDAQAETNILKSRDKLQEYAKQAAATENKLNIITTIDHNVGSGIARISREIMAGIIIVGWPRKAGMLEKLIGEKIDNIINVVEKNLFICHFVNPLIVHQRIVLITPPLSEKEMGFYVWVQKIGQASMELSLPVLHFGTTKTNEAMREHYKKSGFKISITAHEFADWEDILIISRWINENDIILLVSSREGYISHIKHLDHLPTKFEKHFEKNSRIIVFPQQGDASQLSDAYDDISSLPGSMSFEIPGKMNRQNDES